MAKYTVELGELHESGTKIFNFEYPYYDPSKKTEFEQKFIDHFYFREIGQETPARFIHYLKCKCVERLPYYNELIKLTLLEYDVLKPYNISETFEKTNNNTVTGTAAQTGSNTNTLESTTDRTEETDVTKNGHETGSDVVTKDDRIVKSNTPNGLLSMPDIKGNVYASEANIQDGTDITDIDRTNDITENTDSNVTDTVNATSHDATVNNTTTNGSENGSENSTLHRTGHIGVQTASELLLKHAELLEKTQTVLTQFFNECDDLFMQVF